MYNSWEAIQDDLILNILLIIQICHHRTTAFPKILVYFSGFHIPDSDFLKTWKCLLFKSLRLFLEPISCKNLGEPSPWLF